MQVDCPEQAAHHRTKNKAQAHHGAQQAKAFGALLRRRNVGHIGTGNGSIGLHRAAHNTPGDQAGQGGGQGGTKEAQRQAEKTQQQHAPAAKLV